jgi:hypothetical protein
LNSIVDTVPSACVLLSVGYGGGTANENNWNSQYLSILYTLWIRLLLEVYLFPAYLIDEIDNRWASISINTNRYLSIDWYWKSMNNRWLLLLWLSSIDHRFIINFHWWKNLPLICMQSNR